MAEQRIPNPRVGSSNLSTPAIFKALAEMLEPFSFLSPQILSLLLSIDLDLDLDLVVVCI